MTQRIIQVSDLHLSGEFPLFLHNWRALARRIRGLAPDLVLATGDLALAEPDRADDLRFARAELDALGCPVRVLPGNHDVGECDPATGVGLGEQKPVTSARLAQFTRLAGPDCWEERVGRWRLVGVNSQLFGTGLPEESAQWDFIERALRPLRDDSGPILVTHKPLHAPEQGAASPGRAIPPRDSQRLVDLMREAGGHLVMSGHMHRWKSYEARGLNHVWAPSTAFISTQSGHAERGGASVVGMLTWNLAEEALTHSLESDFRLITHDIRNWAAPGGNALWTIVNEPSAAGAARAGRS